MNKYTYFFIGAAMNSKITDKMIEKLSSRAVLNDPINPDLYSAYQDNRGKKAI